MTHAALAQKIARKAGRIFGYVLAGIFGLLLLVVASLNLGPVREFVRGKVNQSLSTSFAGTLRIDRIGYIGIDSLGGVDATVLDAAGRPVVVSRGLSASCRWPDIVIDLVRKRPLQIKLEPVKSDHIEVVLIDDGQGSPTLASAFAARTPTPPSATSSSGPPTTILIPRIDARRIWVHGGLAALAGIDSELADLAVSLKSRGSELDLGILRGRLITRNLPEHANPRGDLRGSLKLRGTTNTTLHARLDFDGSVAGAATKLHAELDDKRLSAEVNMPAVPPATLTSLVPALTPRGPTRVVVNASGELPIINLKGDIENEALKAALTGQLKLEETLRVTAELSAGQVDVSGWVADAPATRLTLDADFALAVPPNGNLTAEYKLRMPPSAALGTTTPSIAVSGAMRQTPSRGFETEGTLDAEETGVKARVRYLFRATPQQRQTLDANLSVALHDSPRLRKLAAVTTQGKLEASAELDLGEQRIVVANAKLSLSKVVRNPDRIDKLDALIRASGALKSPMLDVSLNATDGVVAGESFRKLLVSGAGTLQRFGVKGTLERETGKSMAFETTFSSGNAIELASTMLSLPGERGVPINLRARKVSIAGERIRVDGLELDGAGTLALTGSYGGGRADAEFEANELDVPRLTRALRLETPLKKSIITAKGHIKGPIRRLQGQLEAHIRDIDIAHVRGGRVDVNLDVENQIASGTVAANLGDSRISAKLEDVPVPAPGANLGLDSLQGKLALNGSIELSRVASTLRAAGVPIESASGHLDIELEAESPRERRGLPTTTLSIKTKKLKLVEQRARAEELKDTAEARATEPRALDGVDIDAHISLDPEQNRAALSAKLLDEKGELLAVDAETKLPPGAQALSPAALQHTPMQLNVRVPARELDELPRTFRPASLHGVFQAQIEASGTVLQPKLLANAGVRKFRTREGGRRALNGELMLRYDKTQGELRASASTTRQPNAVFVSSSWQGDLIGKLRDPKGTLDLDAEVKLDKFPVALIPVLSDRALRGPISCDIKLQDLGKDARLDGKIDASGMKLGSVQMQKLDVTLKSEARALLAKLDARDGKGTLTLDVSAPVEWGGKLAPSVDPHVKAKLLAKRFQLEAATPFVSNYVSTLEGELDANFQAELGEAAPKLEGAADVSNGVVQIPQIGQRFSDVRAKVVVDPAGKIKLDSFSARGTSGRVSGNAEATLRGADLVSAKARASIKKNEKLPVTLEGVALGEAWGNIDVNYRKLENDSELRVDVPQFEMEMPETGFGDVQGLDPDEHVRVGVFRADGSFATLPTQPLRPLSSDASVDGPVSTTRVRLHLGDSVWIERGSQARVQLAGDLEITSGQESRIEGRIELRGGKLDVNGKTFDIETGAVSFGGDPSDPTITATARWDAPDATAVYAEYSGTAKAGKLTLHSEPPLTQPEIVSLLLFGSPEGSLGSSNSGGGGAAATAVGVAGDTAVRGFNRVMSDFTHLDVSARIDTSTGSARPEIVVQVTPRLTTRVARALGEPAPGQSPDRTFLTLELRLQRAWAISAVVGDRGASVLDLIWRKRY